MWDKPSVCQNFSDCPLDNLSRDQSVNSGDGGEPVTHYLTLILLSYNEYTFLDSNKGLINDGLWLFRWGKSCDFGLGIFYFFPVKSRRIELKWIEPHWRDESLMHHDCVLSNFQETIVCLAQLNNWCHGCKTERSQSHRINNIGEAAVLTSSLSWINSTSNHDHGMAWRHSLVESYHG